MGFQELTRQVRVPDKEFFPETYAREFVVYLNTLGAETKSDIMDNKKVQMLARRAFGEREKLNIRHSVESLASIRMPSQVAGGERDTVVSTLAPLPATESGSNSRPSIRGRSVSFGAHSMDLSRARDQATNMNRTTSRQSVCFGQK